LREYERAKENLEGEAKRGGKTSYNDPREGFSQCGEMVWTGYV